MEKVVRKSFARLAEDFHVPEKCASIFAFDGSVQANFKFRAQTKCVRPDKAVTCQQHTCKSMAICVCVCVGVSVSSTYTSWTRALKGARPALLPYTDIYI